MSEPKRVSQNSIVGQKGINVIERVLLEMGFTWHPTNQALEAGLDGFLEIRDSATSQVFNSIIFVQSKATEKSFIAETRESFEFICKERDLDYWLQGNAPVILVVSRPKTQEAYWISVKDYFKELSVRSKRKILFEKAKHRFDSSARQTLMQLALPPSSGIYLSPQPRQERVFSNLLPVKSFPPKIWTADTQMRQDWQVKQHFRSKGLRMGGEWFLKEKKVVSFYDLGHELWLEICDQGSIESFDSGDFAYSDEEQVRHEFVRLLKLTLRRKLHHLDIEFDSNLDYFYFKLPEGMKSWNEPYDSISKRTSRGVVEYFQNKRDPERSAYFRHLGFSAMFLLHDQSYYLRVTPTYYYTRDGFRRLEQCDFNLFLAE